ncbi:cbb3-type cytochrome oxidase assembly protein CcoS [Cupriavidus gilardii]|uniref:cbb3-type cytochrome oxidase assembly protein CcoS n=1 Tax=Cupriavidus gilardii TaxID=82541 RepID=UPI001EE54BB6|nr:cbb3-type cytochrome oxidase assembly protein CcoS [Cupriavidus gilardii]MCG5263377.1 cbb3-type cytochrome oxidase assembly protein CcoS [Cupriavidus gilardii]MDF9431768.1 cbb3-type cytochrome oxidase assembly protein CcoS [Cupriavidus gilardii]
METLFLLVPMSLALAALIAGTLWWALRAGQYDDLERPAQAILLDNDRPDADADANAYARAVPPPLRGETRH